MKPEEIKEFYDKASKTPEGNYESKRWFSSPLLEAGFEMTLETLRRRLFARGVGFKNYLEIGPGPGTWTRFFLEREPAARFDLVEISRGMLEGARKRFKDYSNVRYFESDFLNFSSDHKYDFIFSCRALEYLPDKAEAVRKISELLKKDGRGFIVTKTPKYLRYKLRGKEVPALHRGQILPRELAELLKKEGLADLEIYPVVVNFPLWESVFLSKILFALFSRLPLNFISQFFAESYGVQFSKK